MNINCCCEKYNLPVFHNRSDSGIRVKWNVNNRETYLSRLNDDANVSSFHNILDCLDNDNLNETVIDDCVDKFNSILLSSGESHIVNNVNKPNGNVINRNGGWYDSVCREKLKYFKETERVYNVTGNDHDRILMCEA